jgi:hypothetical protein
MPEMSESDFCLQCKKRLIAVNAWMGKICPLAIWENEMRETAGGEGYPGTFVGYYLQKVIYYDLPI